MWNNTEHLVAYLAVPAMGAVLHTLNIRLFPEQLTYVANHAEDHVVLVDGTLVPLLAKVLPTFETVKHVVVVNGDASTLQAPDGVTVHSYADLLADQPDEFEWPAVDENSAAAMCYTSGTTGDPKGVVYTHRSIWLHSMQVCMTDSMAFVAGRPGAGDRAAVPRDVVGPAVRGADGGRVADHAGPVPAAGAAGRDDRGGAADDGRRGADDLAGPARAAGAEAAGPGAAAAGRRRRVGVPAVADDGVRRARRDDHPRVGHDRDLAAGLRVPAAGRAVADEDAWEYRILQGRFPASVRARLIDDDGNELPWDNEAVGELEVRRAVGRGVVLPRRTQVEDGSEKFSPTAGCAPVTSARSRRTASCGSPTGRRTSSSPAASGSRRWTWRTR